jgi:hypothetical protein
MSKGKFIVAVAKLLSVLGVVAAIAVLLVLYVMARKDKEHERFYNTGKSVNTFLASYKHGLEEAYKKKDATEVLHFYSSHYASPERGRWVLNQDHREGDVSCLKMEQDGEKDYTIADLREELEDYLNGLASMDDVKFKIDMIEKVELERTVQLTVKFILDGKDRQGAIFQDRNFYRWYLSNEGGPQAYDWKIVGDELVEGVRVGGDGKSFIEVEPQSIGLDYRHERDPKLNIKSPDVHLKFGVIEHGFGGTSAVDYNNDGRQDIFFADGKRSRLYRNDGVDELGQPKFADVTREAGLDGIDQANAGIFADVDNDGCVDLFVARYLAPNKFYHNNGDGTFTERPHALGLDLVGPSMSACFLDYDRDGYLDLYVGLYGDATRALPRLPFFAQNGGKNRLYHNDGGRGFTDVTDQSGTGDTGWTLAVASADYDNDGYPDIADANDFGRKNLYHNNHDGTFTEAAKQAGVLDFSGGMGVTFGDFDDDGFLDLYTSNINSNQRWFGEDMTVTQYMRNVMRTKYILTDMGEYLKVYQLLGSRWPELGQMIGEGNRLFHNNGDSTFKQFKESHTNRAGWGWDVAFLDYDNDGRLDIYAANGWISNAPNTDL